MEVEMSSKAEQRVCRFGVAAVAVMVTLGGPAIVSSNPAGAAPPLPQVDEFYQPPAGFESAAPGAILRSRPIELVAPLPAQAWQLLYRTTDVFERPDVTVTTVFLPDNVRPDRPLVSQQMFEDASGPQCVPSYGLQAGAQSSTETTGQIKDLQTMLSNGWVVSVPDFGGRFGHFPVAQEPGFMTLDGIRAATQFAPLGLGSETRVGLFGYSGGGFATGWTAELQPSYAPELNLAGAAYGGPGADINAALFTTNGGPFSAIVGSGLSSYYATYPEVKAAMRPHLTPEGAAVMDQIQTQCLSKTLAQQFFGDWKRYFDIPLDQVLALPPLAEVINEARLGTHAPSAPLYVFQAVPDEVIPVGSTDRMVEDLCARGASVTYIREQLAEHLSMIFSGAPAAFSWLGERLNADTPAPTGCSSTTVLSQFIAPK
ncbi:lipase family protein [Nocardia sp. NPDC046473]|uniref:lipase family protein n=1 Tax=Nocardia sp. NPDC046473 TaxID=3155733 RepID=UPI00341163D9